MNIDTILACGIMKTVKKYIFIRDDDVFGYEESFLRIFDLLKTLRIPVIYGVIPGLVEKKLVSFLNKEKNKNPDLFDIVQHGWKHKNFSRNLHNKYEFGALRSYSQQKQNILKGYSKMKKLFKNNFTPAFIPPYHGYNLDTLKSIKELKIPIFSAEKHNSRLISKYTLELPIQFSLNNYDERGEPLPLTATSMVKQLLRFSSNPENILGMVFHHKALRTKKNFCETKIFLNYLRKIREQGIVKIILFSDILKACSCIQKLDFWHPSNT